jgi:antitoxin ParD1/3/4
MSIYAMIRAEVSVMATMNVSLPDPMKDWVEAQAQTGRYSNASDYVRDLIRRDQERISKLAELQKLITQGLESGVSDRSISEVLEAARKQEEAARDHEL